MEQLKLIPEEAEMWKKLLALDSASVALHPWPVLPRLRPVHFLHLHK